MHRKSQRGRTDGAQRDHAPHRAGVSPRHTRLPPPLCIRCALHSTSKNDGGVHQEAQFDPDHDSEPVHSGVESTQMCRFSVFPPF